MSSGASPVPFATSFRSLPGLTTATLAWVGPLGADAFTNFATAGPFATHPLVPSWAPAGRANAPATLEPSTVM